MKDKQIEERWISEAARGDRKAFEQLIQCYESKIYHLCLSLLKNSDEAYDAAQEVCVKIWKQLVTFKGDARIGTWIYRITTNTCLDLLRQRKRQDEKITSLDDYEKLYNQEKLIHGEDLSTWMIEKEKLSIVWHGISELKKEYQTLIILRDIEGYTYEEIALFTGTNIGTVKSRLFRARMKLKQVLEQEKEPYCSFFKDIQ